MRTFGSSTSPYNTRALLYCALAIAWFRLKQRIRRIEILVLLLVLLIEGWISVRLGLRLSGFRYVI